MQSTVWNREIGNLVYAKWGDHKYYLGRITELFNNSVRISWVNYTPSSIVPKTHVLFFNSDLDLGRYHIGE